MATTTVERASRERSGVTFLYIFHRWFWLIGAVGTVAAASFVVFNLSAVQDSSRVAGEIGELRAFAERIRSAAVVDDETRLRTVIDQRREHSVQLSTDLADLVGEPRAGEQLTPIDSAFARLEVATRDVDQPTLDGLVLDVTTRVDGLLEELAADREHQTDLAYRTAAAGIIVALLSTGGMIAWGFMNREQARRMGLREAAATQRFEQVVEHSTSAFLSADLTGQVLEVRAAEANKAVRAWAGRNLFEMMRHEVFAQEGLRFALEGALVTREIDLGGRTYRFNWFPRLHATGAIEGVDAIVTDITEETRAERQLRDTFDGIIGVITKLTDLTDPYTKGHEETVADIAEAIAHPLGLSERSIEGLRMAARLHDTGKIALPAVLLSRPGPLVPAEFELIKTHVDNARHIFAGVEFPWPEIDAIYEHHERMDGSGYPRGLRGDEISLAGRILAVADVCDAMTSHRPYRPARTKAQLVDELRRGRGTCYDAAAVETAVRLIESGEMPFRQSLGSDRHGEVLSLLA